MSDVLARLQSRTELRRKARSQSPVLQEIRRVLELPIQTDPITEEEVEAFCEDFMLREAFERGDRLWPAQVEAILAWQLNDGLLGQLVVGAGKSALAYSIATLGYSSGEHRKIAIFVPPQVARDFAERHLRFARRMIPIPFDVFNLHGLTKAKRRKFYSSGRDGVYILPYSLLSVEDSEEMLRAIGPSLIIADEAHNLRHASAARTQRVRRYLDDAEPSFVAMSGTITSKSLTDYWHLAIAALKDRAPLPRSAHALRAWTEVLDSHVEASSVDMDFGRVSNEVLEPVWPLVQWARRNFPDEQIPDNQKGFRTAYQLRLTSAPGVVTTLEGADALGTSLIFDDIPIEGHQDREGWDRIEELVDDIENRWVAPNGDEIDHAMHKWRWLWELAAGFYNELYWPEVEDLAKQRGVSLVEAEDLLGRAKLHHGLLQVYHRELRGWLQRNARPQLDTPMLVGRSMSQHGRKEVGDALYWAWKEAKDAEFEGMPKRLSRPVRVCDFRANAAVEWAQNQSPHGGVTCTVPVRRPTSWPSASRTPSSRTA